MTRPPRRRDIREQKQHRDRYREGTRDSDPGSGSLRDLQRELQTRREPRPAPQPDRPPRRVYRPDTPNYQPHRRQDPTGSRHCPHCPAQLIAHWIDGQLVSVAIVHLRHCPTSPGLQVELPLADW